MTIHARALMAAFLVAGCAQKEQTPGASLTPAEQRTATEARIRELEQQARALVRTEGCDHVDQCASAPVGVKGCGGPHSYLVYCRATTDEAALLRTLDELKRVEGEYNQAYEIASDCVGVMPPPLRLEARTCAAGSP